MILLGALVLFAGQAGTPPASSKQPVPERFSVLTQNCPPAHSDTEVVVCGDGTSGARLPLPDDRGPPDHPTPSNPKIDGAGALAASATPCAATQGGCQVGIGPPPELINAAIGAIKSAFAKKPDKRGRVAIPLDDTPASSAGRVLP
ncbi:hypothetical protein SAMN05192583_0961 [Sphingomonas gellani]|uniref:Uncharacterized protein n=1 Tax=Sphingomonas gellani TaxID=1166340 RepID=A0A1H8ANS7_9SPHN|nr:hypothetical protein [Sphingomonas gellani]SEM71429.1 hypothetical protein SAMN05192583_0961 [Sphingomonas gellani]